MFRALLSHLLLIPISGCVYCQAKIRNATDETIRVKTIHTGEVVTISPGHSTKFAHSGGDLLVEAKAKLLMFRDVGVFVGTGQYSHHGAIFNWVCTHFLLDKHWRIYALRPGARTVDKNCPQPEGYPKTGEDWIDAK